MAGIRRKIGLLSSEKTSLNYSKTMDKYFVTVKGHPPIEITKEQFMAAETSHGFRSNYPGHPATGGFSGGPVVSYSVRSIVTIERVEPAHATFGGHPLFDPMLIQEAMQKLSDENEQKAGLYVRITHQCDPLSEIGKKLVAAYLAGNVSGGKDAMTSLALFFGEKQ